MKNLFHHCKIAIYCFFAYFFSFGHLRADDYQSYLLKKLDDPTILLLVTKQLYINSFPTELAKKKKNETEEERLKRLKRKAYEVEKPSLMAREQAEIIFDKIFTTSNPAFISFFSSLGAFVDMRGATAQSVNLLQGTTTKPEASIVNSIMPNGSEPGKGALAIMLMEPLFSVKKIEERKNTIKSLVNHPKEMRAIHQAITGLKKELPALLSLWNGENDPLWSSAYKKILFMLFPSGNKKLSSWLKIEFFRRLGVEVNSLIMLVSILSFPVAMINGILNHFFSIPNLVPILGAIYFPIGQLVAQNLSVFLSGPLAVVCVFFIFVSLYPVYKAYQTYKAIHNYVVSRLKDVQVLLETARIVDQVIRNNPELEKRLGSQLQYTRKVLEMRHENPACNKFIARFFSNNFKNFGFFFNSPGTLFTTLNAVEEHINVLNGILFELAKIEVFLAVADLIVKNQNHKNKYSYATFKHGASPYIKLPGVWNPIIGRTAVPNDVTIDGTREAAYCITGPNACGKSMISRAIGGNLILGQTFGIMATNSPGTITVFGALFMSKEPQDDVGRKKSLFAVEVEDVETLLDILRDAKEYGYNVFISFDEFFKATNLVERISLQNRVIDTILTLYPNAIISIATHNFLLINNLKNNPRAQVVQVMIRRFADGAYEPLYTVREGESKEKVGIDLFLKQTSENSRIKEIGAAIAKEAKKEAKKVQKKMDEIGL